MSYGMTSNDQMFSAREMPWHRLGLYPKSIDEALKTPGSAGRSPTATCSWSRRQSGPMTSGPNTRRG
jgi:hypothetical protein